jgi:hypothetical protein
MPQPHRSDAPNGTPGLQEAREEVDRILASDTLRASEVLRRLLKFLAEKTFSGEADHLKEYSVGLDALGKPPGYDPRQDAGVRLQASRLRVKLDKYYRSEGRNDPLTIEMPRGRFKIVWRPRDADNPSVAAVALPSMAAPLGEQTNPGADSRSMKKWRSVAIGLAAFSGLLAFVSIWSLAGASRTVAAKSAIPASSPELDALWNPFLYSAHHLIIAFSNPLFIRFQRSGNPDLVYRTRGMNGWDDAVSSPEFAELSRTLGKPSSMPSFNFVERSNVVSIFVLSQFLARRRSDMSLVRLSDLSWQQFAENDIILLAPPQRIDERQSALPVKPAFTSEKDGIRNLRPSVGEPLMYEDAEDHQESDGKGLELVSVLPGPLGRTTVVSFAGTHAWGVIGCVQALTDPAFGRTVVQKLREPSGQLPRYYQIIIRVGYRDGTATDASYVTHRALTLTQNSLEVQH